MLLIPEIETVFIRVPGTASGSIKSAVMAAYPKTLEIYHHMERGGIPHGYEHWPVCGVFRDPIERLWGLYNFCRNLNDTNFGTAAWREKHSKMAEADFETWLMINTIPFTDPFSSEGNGKFYPQYNVLYRLPEQRKSQSLYLDPASGTEIFGFDDLRFIMKRLNIPFDTLPHKHQSTEEPAPELSEPVKTLLNMSLKWDFDNLHLKNANGFKF